jgi:hypothetical protein
MGHDVVIAQEVGIREAGFDEYWLQDQIYENPACLGLGELDALSKERSQSSGGRLDILLKNAEDDSMYEVEVMLGDTDETHIIRTIEYWDNEKRRWPQRQHYAVLVAERVNRRFFNVIHLLSHSIPIIAIQVALLETDGKRSLHFTKVLDTYEEIDDGASLIGETYNRDYWQKRAKWTLETADVLLNAAQGALKAPTLNFLKFYIAINDDGTNWITLHKRSSGKSLLTLRFATTVGQDQAVAFLNESNISYVPKQQRRLVLVVDREQVESSKSVFSKLISLAQGEAKQS